MAIGAMMWVGVSVMLARGVVLVVLTGVMVAVMLSGGVIIHVRLHPLAHVSVIGRLIHPGGCGCFRADQ